MVTAFPDFANHMLSRRPKTEVGREVIRMERARPACIRNWPPLDTSRSFGFDLEKHSRRTDHSLTMAETVPGPIVITFPCGPAHSPSIWPPDRLPDLRIGMHGLFCTS